MKTEQQLQNLRDALEWWPTVPEANVAPRLHTWSTDSSCETSCNTVGGWACRHPLLIAQGAGLNYAGEPKVVDPASGFLLAQDFGVAKVLFGDLDLFRFPGNHPADEGFTGPDHALVMNRLRWALEH